MNSGSIDETIDRISVREFGRSPDGVRRMTTGNCNEVYDVRVGEREYIFRLNREPRFMLGSRRNIPLFRSKGIKVPDILAEDYSLSFVPYAFQIQSKIAGRDIDAVIAELSDDELRGVAAEVANVFRQLAAVPNNGKFGVLWGDDTRDLFASWWGDVEHAMKVARSWGRKTGVLDKELDNVFTRIAKEYREYFERVRPYTYFGDISSKNVMIDEGRFAGLVDLDGLGQGDPLEAVGRIKASWYGTRHGEVYSNAVMDSLGLPDAQRKAVTMYALLNRALWTLENGIRFNQNTSAKVDRERERTDKDIVRALAAELWGAPEIEPVNAESKPPPAAVPQASPEPAPKPLPVIPEPEKKPRKRVIKAEHESEPASLPEPLPEPEPAHDIATMIPMPEIGPDAAVDHAEPDLLLDEILAEAPPPVVRNPQPQPQVTGKVVLEASGLSKTYVTDGMGFNALSNVDLKIAKGDCLAIVGKSGSGKSTLMHLLACLDAPTEGYVYVDGDDTSTMNENEKNHLRNQQFGFVFQQFFLNGRETVYENVALPLRIRGEGDGEIAVEAEAALAAVGLADKSDKRAKDLSGGEKQRVCIARALVGRPNVIFADEPTGNLDSHTGEAVEKLLFDLNREKGITLVIVTHDSELAMRCSRVVEMKDGRIVEERRNPGF